MTGPGDAAVVDALGLLAAGRSADALAVLTADRAAPGSLRHELARYLSARHDGRVYEDPAAFRAFIGGGGNVALYAAVSGTLTAVYRELDARHVLDVGCGDGRAVLPAAAELGARAPELHLVEPSAALLAEARAAAARAGLAVTTLAGTAQDLLADGDGRRWDLVEATFALHAIPTARRTEVLAGLRERAGSVLVVEFDVPGFADGGPEHLAYLARRYEAGLAEYTGDGGLVAQGFLVPVLVGQVEPGRVRNTWEQPAHAWAAQLVEAGWRDVTVAPLADYWWAPAVVATGRR